MCGIAGIAGKGIDRESAHRQLKSVLSAMAHRGPDGTGIVHRAGAHLGHVRLSIIDIERGSQPMANEDHTIWLVFNGEIYNFRELRDTLQEQGHRFATDSDSEVIIHLYEEKGADLVNDLQGMFAFGLWDEKRNILLIARDRFGQKPLYFQDSGPFVFASELRALMRFDYVHKDVDNDRVADYLVYNYVPAPGALIKGVKKLPPGHLLEYKNGTSRLINYYKGPQTLPALPETDLIDRFWGVFDQAVERRLISDVPLGVFLSGGIDSTAIATSMVRLLGPDRVKAFCIGFTVPDFDESSHASMVASSLKMPLNINVLDEKAVTELFPDIASISDEPVSDNSIIPTYLLARFARQGITVALSGDGGDELFLGYPTFNADMVARAIRAIPLLTGVSRVALKALLRLMRVDYGNISRDFQVRRFLRGLGLDTANRHAAYLGAVTPAEASRLLLEPWEQPFDIRTLYPKNRGWDLFQQLSWFYLRTYLAEDVLVKVDRATMAASLEARAPFLDTEVVDFAFSLPWTQRFNPLKTKVFLRRALAARLPDIQILNRPKKGFGMPVGHWFRGPLRPLLERELAPELIRSQGVLNPNAVNNLMQEHLAGKADNRMILFSVLLLQLWIRKYL